MGRVTVVSPERAAVLTERLAQAGLSPFLDLLSVFLDELLQRFGGFLGAFVEDVAQFDRCGWGRTQYDDQRDYADERQQRNYGEHEPA